MNGILVVDKPVGITSQVVISRVRRAAKERRVGHCGTLDPLASGVLPVMIGKATKACDFLMDHEKSYVASIRLGMTTDSEDVTGEVLTRHEGPLPSFADFRAAAETFVGDIEQVPPMYSALKQNGQKLVDLARKGVTVERAPRGVTIHALHAYEQNGEFCMEVRCSRGTYIRTLCADIGAKLGCGGCMQSLRRTEVGQFSLAQSVTMEALNQMTPDEVEAHLIPIEHVFASLPLLSLPSFYATLYSNGERIALSKLKQVQANVGDRFRIRIPDGRLTIGEIAEADGEKRLFGKIFF